MTWEYRKLGLRVGACGDTPDQPADDSISELNRLGREGWEIARVIPLTGDPCPTHSIVFLLRRQGSQHVSADRIAGTYLGL
jgi:hypothetical protein